MIPRTCPQCERDVIHVESRLAEMPSFEGEAKKYEVIGLRYFHDDAPRICDRATKRLVPA